MVKGKSERMISMSGLTGPLTEVFCVSADHKTVAICSCTLSSAQIYGMCKMLTAFFEKEGRAFDAEEREVIIEC